MDKLCGVAGKVAWDTRIPHERWFKYQQPHFPVSSPIMHLGKTAEDGPNVWARLSLRRLG